MFEFFSKFVVSDWIEFFGIVASLIVSIISIVIAILSLRQNNKMLEESTRPYIAVSYEVLLSGEPLIYIVIKNYGNTGALITDFSYTPLIDDSTFNEKISKVQGAFIAPNQKMLYSIKPSLFKSDDVTFFIAYQNGCHTYTDTQTVKIRVGRIVVRSNEENSIKHSLQEISERLI